MLSDSQPVLQVKLSSPHLGILRSKAQTHSMLENMRAPGCWTLHSGSLQCDGSAAPATQSTGSGTISRPEREELRAAKAEGGGKQGWESRQ